MTKREKTFYWVLKNILRYDDGRMMRWYEIFVRFLFMPLNTLWYCLVKHNKPFDDYGMTITLHGIKYGMDVFRQLGGGLPLNTAPFNVEDLYQAFKGRLKSENKTVGNKSGA